MKIVNIFEIIKALVEESEILGLAGVKSHSSILKKRIMTINIQNLIPTNKILPKLNNFELTVFGNTTIWEIKELIAKKLEINPGIIMLHIKDSSISGDSKSLGQEISPKDHGKTLIERKIKNGDIFIVRNNGLSDALEKSKLLKENGDFIPRFKEVITNIFQEYSTDGKMSRIECAKFLNTAYDSNQPFEVNDYIVQNIFEKYQTDQDDNYLDLNGFFKYFMNSIELMGRNNLIWNMLKKLGYRNDLKRSNGPLDCHIIEKEYLPRFIISSNQSYFSELFSLQNENMTIAHEAYKFLQYISTNHEILNRVIYVERQFSKVSCNEIVWEDLFSSNKTFQ